MPPRTTWRLTRVSSTENSWGGRRKGPCTRTLAASPRYQASRAAVEGKRFPGGSSTRTDSCGPGLQAGDHGGRKNQGRKGRAPAGDRFTATAVLAECQPRGPGRKIER